MNTSAKPEHGRCFSAEIEEFTEFFCAIHGYNPFPWQKRLMEQVLERKKWPDIIDIPTGAGKTAALDIAVFAMSCHPKSPRRIVFVVDRRIVVDQVFKRAKKIRDCIESAHTGVLAKIGERLRDYGGGRQLGVAMMRGGIPLDNEWARRPDQPWVMVSTVDQFGSRLLFRGYGTSRSMHPIHAGLAGNDCLVILDEVHLSIPFAHTLAHIADQKSPQLGRRFDVVEMSATPSRQSAERFMLDPVKDLDECKDLARRIRAKKKTEMVKIRDPDAIPGKVLDIIKSEDKISIRSVGIVVNRVKTARNTFRALQDAQYNVFLITGRMRPLDRADVLMKIEDIVNPDVETPNGLAVVVATPAIEVGADFSFDMMITECAPVDSLRQRFGRLDRRGRHRDARAYILGPKSVINSTKPDPVYGHAIKATWEELQRREESGVLDAGPLKWSEFPAGTSAPKLEAPLLQKTHLDAWVQTNPEPIVQPSIKPFLHGMQSKHIPDVSVAWRRDMSTVVLKAVPPRKAECVQVSIAETRNWLKDKEAAAKQNGTDDGRTGWTIWRNHKCVDGNADDILPGDTIIVYPSMGGLMGGIRTNGKPSSVRTDNHGDDMAYFIDPRIVDEPSSVQTDTRGEGPVGGTWDPSSTDTVKDIGDYAQVEHGGRATLRLDNPDLAKTDPPRPSDEDHADTSIYERMDLWLKELGDGIDPAIIKIVNMLGNKYEIMGMTDNESDEGYYVLVQRKVDTTTMHGTDESESQIGTGVTLRAHLDGVGARARDTARRLNFPDAVVADLHLAGTLHDIGKVDERFQDQLVGGDPIEKIRQGEPLAKSLPGVRGAKSYPKGMRHEVASVAMVESNPDAISKAVDEDLVLYLIGTHHGYGRPLPPIIRDPDPRTLSYEFDGHRMESSSDLVASNLAASTAERFWRLTDRYGYYGLAWLEAIFRLADHQQSAEESQ